MPQTGERKNKPGTKTVPGRLLDFSGGIFDYARSLLTRGAEMRL
jgi:hypothetical protein